MWAIMKKLRNWTVDNYHYSLLILVVVCSQAALLIRRVIIGSFNVNIDAALYMHGGWYMTEGGIPYLEFFSVKPPLAWETPAIFALISGDNMYLLYILSVSGMILTLLGIVLINSYLVHFFPSFIYCTDIPYAPDSRF
jgi:hypothetical protein